MVYQNHRISPNANACEYLIAYETAQSAPYIFYIRHSIIMCLSAAAAAFANCSCAGRRRRHVPQLWSAGRTGGGAVAFNLHPKQVYAST